MKVGQLIEYNMRNIYLEKSHTRCGGETRLRPFYKKFKIEHKFNKIVSTACPSGGLPKYTRIKVLTTCFDLIIKLLWKTKRCLELVSLLNFLNDSCRKIFLKLYYITRLTLIVWLRSLLEILSNICIIINVINFEINLQLLYQAVFPNDQNTRRKI